MALEFMYTRRRMLSRRQWFQRTVGAVAAAALTPFLSVSTGPRLQFHRDAFAATDPQLGISIRYIRHYDAQRARYATRMDVLYGYAVLKKDSACRVRVS